MKDHDGFEDVIGNLKASQASQTSQLSHGSSIFTRIEDSLSLRSLASS